MIHDAKVEVTCDAVNCDGSVEVELDYVYSTYSEKSGRYDDSDEAIEEALVVDYGWTVEDGEHFCDFHEDPS